MAMVRLLVEAKVPLDKQDQDGYTPLAIAVMNSNEDVANYLIEEGASIKVYSPKFGSILHLAVAVGSIKLVKLLISLGADSNEADVHFGEELLYTALRIEDEKGLLQMMRYLVDEVKVPVDKSGGKFGYFIIRAANMAQKDHLLNAKCFKFMIRRNAQLNVSDDQGRRAMHHGCISWWDGGIKALVKAGADVDIKDKMGRMPIHFAAGSSYENCLTYLLDKYEDTDVNVADQDNWTPLLWAAHSGDVDSIPKLLD